MRIAPETRVLTRWDLEGAALAPMTGGTANRNWRVRHGAGEYVLRQRSPRYIRPDQIAFDHALMRHLAACGLSGPNPILTLSGDTCARLDEDVFELHRFFPGRAVEWNSESDLKVAAKTLRRWHEAAATFVSPVSKQYPREDAPPDILAGLDELEEEMNGDPRALEVIEKLRSWAHRIQDALPDSRFRALPNQVVHGDFHPGNVLMSVDSPGVMGVFDIDCASIQPRARDVADALLYFCARRDGPFDASNIQRLTRECWLEPSRNRAFVDAYGALRDDEREALVWLVAARWIYSRVRGRLKLPREVWGTYLVEGMMTPLDQIEQGQALL